MADKLRLYVPCPTCNGTGKICWGVTEPNRIEFKACPRCADETPPAGAKVFDGIRHIYYGRFEEVVEE